MTYAKFADVKVGDTLIADGGFTCLKDGDRLVVYAHPDDGELEVPCSCGGHGLGGQVGEEGELIGLSKAEG